MDRTLVMRGVALMLEGLDCDLSDPNFADTPERVARAYVDEIFRGVGDVRAEVDKILSTTFPCSHDEMIVAKGIEVYSMCPHHVLPVHYMITVGYIPSERVLGISKLARIVKLLAARPVLQEQMVNDVVDALMRVPGCMGAGCIAEGEHYCMRMRGVNQTGSTIVTSSLRGALFSNAAARSEFMSLSR